MGLIFSILKEKNFQPRISYPAKLSFISEGEIKPFIDKQMMRDFCHCLACLTKAPEGSTKRGKELLVPATGKTANCKDHQHYEETTSTNGQNNQLAS